MKSIIENKELLASYRAKRCAKCGSNQLTVAHHVRSKGAAGDDVDHNLMPLCFQPCHGEVHQMGLVRFALVYPHVKKWLINNGWEYVPHLNKWRRYECEQSNFDC